MACCGWIDRLRSPANRSEGQTMAEYAVVLGVIVPAIILAYALFSDDIAKVIDSVRSIFG